MGTTQNTQTVMDTTQVAQVPAQPLSTKLKRRDSRDEAWDEARAKNTRRILENPHTLEDTVAFEASVGNKPRFTRELLERAVAHAVRANSSAYESRNVIIPHLLGGGEWKPPCIWGSDDGWRLDVRFVPTFELTKEKGRKPLYTLMSQRGFLIENILRPDDIDTNPVRKTMAEEAPSAALVSEMVAMQQRIEASQAMEKIKTLLSVSPVQIDNIVCLALGNLCKPNARIEYMRGEHILACAIADCLAEHNDSASTIPILAFDPEYDVEACRLLAHLPHPIHVVSSPYEYLSITPNTLVICLGIPLYVPAYEIMADLLFPSGPAALMCIELQHKPWHAKGLNSQWDPLVPRVAKMLEHYEVDWLGDVVPKVQDGGLEELQWLRIVNWYSRKD